jgi:hypothetical protein
VNADSGGKANSLLLSAGAAFGLEQNVFCKREVVAAVTPDSSPKSIISGTTSVHDLPGLKP